MRTNEPQNYVFSRESADPRYAWRQIIVVRDGQTIVIDCEQALFGGWRFGAVTRSKPDAWPNMDRDAIVTWIETWWPYTQPLDLAASARALEFLEGAQ